MVCGGTSIEKSAINRGSRRDKTGTWELPVGNMIQKIKAKMMNGRFLKKHDHGFKRRDFTIPKINNPGMRNEKAINGNEVDKKDNTESKRGGKDSTLQTKMQKLQSQIFKTTMEIDSLYKSFSNKSDSTEVKNGNSMKNENNREQEGKKSMKNMIGDKDVLCSAKTANSCCNEEVARLRNQLKLERGVRNQMIRILARERLENERKTKALQAVLKYYHPDNEILKKLSLPTRLKRVIIAERIKLLPIDKQMEFARRLKKLKGAVD